MHSGSVGCWEQCGLSWAGWASGTGGQGAQCWLSPVTLALSQKGVFQLSNEDYFIEPLDGVPARPGHAQPHVVYKRQAPEREAALGDSGAPGTCGVQGMRLCSQLWGRGRAGGIELLSRSLSCPHPHAQLPSNQRDADRRTDPSP